MGLLIHPDILSKVNCAQTSQTALSNPAARSPMIGWSRVKQAQMCSALNISQLWRAREGLLKNKKKKERGRERDEMREQEREKKL